MAKFSEKTFLNFTSEEYSVSDVMDDYRDAIRQEICSVGDHFFFYQKGLFQKSVLSMEHVIWMFPYREAPAGRGGTKMYNDIGKIAVYSDKGQRFDFSFPTPMMAETIYGMLASTFAEDYHIITGMSTQLQRAMEQGGINAFREELRALQAKYQSQQR